jgi:hypothetical protein
MHRASWITVLPPEDARGNVGRHALNVTYGTLITVRRLRTPRLLEIVSLTSTQPERESVRLTAQQGTISRVLHQGLNVYSAFGGVPRRKISSAATSCSNASSSFCGDTCATAPISSYENARQALPRSALPRAGHPRIERPERILVRAFLLECAIAVRQGPRSAVNPPVGCQFVAAFAQRGN